MEYRLMIWTDEKVQRFWDYLSQFPEHYFTHQVGGEVARRIKKYLGNGKRLLDYGSGPGFLIKHLLEKGIDVTALEFSVKSLEEIKKNYDGKSGFHGAWLPDELEKRNEKFDVVTLVEVIEHLDDRYLDLTMENIRKLLNPGGYLVITTPNNENLERSYICNPETGELFHRWQHIRSWNTESLQSFLKGKGYKVHEIRETNFNKSLFSEKLLIPKKLLKKMLGISLSNDIPHLYCVCSPESR